MRMLRGKFIGLGCSAQSGWLYILATAATARQSAAHVGVGGCGCEKPCGFIGNSIVGETTTHTDTHAPTHTAMKLFISPHRAPNGTIYEHLRAAAPVARVLCCCAAAIRTTSYARVQMQCLN